MRQFFCILTASRSLMVRLSCMWVNLYWLDMSPLKSFTATCGTDKAETTAAEKAVLRTSPRADPIKYTAFVGNSSGSLYQPRIRFYTKSAQPNTIFFNAFTIANLFTLNGHAGNCPKNTKITSNYAFGLFMLSVRRDQHKWKAKDNKYEDDSCPKVGLEWLNINVPHGTHWRLNEVSLQAIKMLS